MKKIISIMLTIVLALAVFAGCTENTVKPSKTTDPYSPTPTPGSQVAEKFIPEFKSGDVIEFNIFNTSDYQSRWGDATKEYILEKYMLKVANEIPGIQGYEDTAQVVGGNYMESEAKRLEYNSKIALLFTADETTPDFWTSLYASNIALDAPWLDFAPYLVDLSEYVAEGGPLYEGYLNWVWNGEQDYWEQFKTYLETEDGELFVLPRREMMPIRTFTSWNKEILSQLGIEYTDRATDWNTFVSQLKSAKQLSGTGISLQTYCGNIKDLLKFVASTYGLDFNDDFSWTTKNGEPLWTYSWGEYLNILTDVKELAEEHLVYNDKTNKNLVLGYDLNATSSTITRVVGNENKWGNTTSNSGLFFFGREDRIAWLGREKWQVSDTWVTHDGYEYSMFGSSQFDVDYYAISNRINKKRGDSEFVLRICQYMAEFMTDEGLLTYQWGQRGVPFADTVDEAGSWEYIDIDGEQKVLFTNIENRFSWTRDTAQPGWNQWFWEGRSDNWYAEELDPHYEQYIKHILEVGDKQYQKEVPGYKESNAEIVGITDTGCWDNFLNWRRGLYFFGDVTAYPMQYTAYWRMESMSQNSEPIKTITANCESHNGVIYTGFFKSTSYVLGSNAAAMTDKISALKKIAKNFTTDFLSGNKDASAWTQYIQSLEEAGFYDVYNYYNEALEVCETEHIDTIVSQSDVNKQLGQIIKK